MKHKLLIYAHQWAPTVGGVQTVTMDLARGICDWSNAHPDEAWEITLVTQTPANGMNDSVLPFRVLRRPSLAGLGRIIAAVDIVHLAGPSVFPLALATVMRKRIVVEHHGFQACCPNGLLFFEPSQSPCPGHFMAGRQSLCVECNRASMNLLRSLLLLAKTRARRWMCGLGVVNILPTAWLDTELRLKNTTTICHGVMASPLPPMPATPPLTIGFQGRLVSTKGVNLLLRAASQLQAEGLDFRLKIIGDGPQKTALELQARELREGSVSFLGCVPPEQFEAALADVSVVAVPSLGGEVFGLVVAENMLRSKALVVSDIGSLAEVIGDAGLVVETGSVPALTEALRRLLSNPKLPSALGSTARARALAVFRIEQMVRKHVDLYEKLIR